MQNAHKSQIPAINILSFDIEEWFMLEDTSVFPVGEWTSFEPRLYNNTLRVLDVLDGQQTKGVFYFLGWVAEHYPELVKAVHAAGHEIGYHTYHHHNVDMFTPEAFESDLARGLDLLAQITGSRPTLFRAPNFSLHSGNLWAIPILLRNGITVSSSLRNLTGPSGITYPSTPFQWECGGQHLWEFPLASGRIGPLRLHYAGSGYFRLLPDCFIAHFMGKSNYNLFYFHPRDFDPRPPLSPKLSPVRNLKNRIRTRTALSRLQQLIVSHKFIPMREALELLNTHGLHFSKLQVPVLQKEENFY